MRACPRCGAENRDEARFCDSCGVGSYRASTEWAKARPPAARSSAAAGSGAGNGRCEKDGRGRAESGDKREQMIAPFAHGARG
jgi:zinc-ribbon domain